ncbi:MAG: T9SS type A sorting domain-containing protein [Rhodothermales bacterium]
MYRQLLCTLLLSLLALSPAFAQSEIVVDDAAVSGDVTWTADNTYVLDGFVFVEDGSSLTIEAGTVVKGKPGQGENAAALIVARGGKIFANGTPANPIIFTAEADDVTDPDDLPLDARGLWGGVLILGKADLNSTPGETTVEGIPTSEPRGTYGCGVTMTCDNEDNSGVFRYVSIRHGGSDIGAGNEINGLSMGGVGSATTIEFVEVFNNQDDGFEWFGGTVNTRYLVSAFNGDDAFDIDEGFRGKGQFWFAIQDAETANRGCECDGGTDPEDGTPFTIPTILNATFLGSGASSANADNDHAMILRDNAGGKWYNSVFHDFVGTAVEIEDLASGEDSRARLEAGDIVLAGNIYGSFGGGLSEDAWAADYLTAAAQNNRTVDPQLRGISRTNDGGLDPRPAAGSPALSGALDIGDSWFVDTEYVGAFGDVNWAADWSFIADVGVLTTAGAGNPDVETAIEPVDGEIPAHFALAQNYPNPFNPATTIAFTLNRTQDVTLSVYNILGRQVGTLIDGMQPAGTYEVPFDGSGLASGTYLYVLQTENQVAVRKMSLIK